jgi:selenocysteine lyase/cysteine desulfurase
MSLNVARLRAETPGCAQVLHLNAAGSSLPSRRTLDATLDHLRLEAEIGGYEAADARADDVARVYDDVAALVRARGRNIAVTASATAAFVQALGAFDFARGDVIVTSRGDYVSNQIQYLALARRLGVRVVHAPDLPEGGVDPDAVRALVAAHRPALVAVSWIPTSSGLVQDVEAVGEVCAACDVPYLVDACQAVGQMPVDVERLRCDYLAATARKFLRGPRGIGFLFVSDRALARGDHPLSVDMQGARWAAEDHYELFPTAARFEEWEKPYALVLGLGAAARYARTVGLETAQARAWGLAAYARERLAALPGVRVQDRGAVRCAIVTATVAGYEAAEVVARLAAEGINTTPTLRAFSVLDFDEKGIASALRLSPHYYNLTDEVDRLVDVIATLAPRR